MTPIETVLQHFPGARKTSTGWQACCPAHDDRTPSLSIAEGEGKRVLLKCHAGCRTEDVVKAAGLTMADLMADSDRGPQPHFSNSRGPSTESRATPNSRPYKSITSALAALERQVGGKGRVWVYRDKKGEPAGANVRFDLPTGKTYRPMVARDGQWFLSAMAEPRPLYELPSLEAASVVVVTEGEKAADAAKLLGYVATTSFGGANAAAKADWTPLAGKEVWITPDNDEAGIAYADDAADQLLSLRPPAIVRIVALPGRPPKGDIADLVEDKSSDELATLRQAVDELAAHTPPVPEPTSEPSLLRYRPFPTELLPEPLRSLVAEASASVRCDPSYVALPLLASCGAAIGTSRCLKAKQSWSAPPVLWVAIVGESGSAKSPAMAFALDAIRKKQNEAHLEMLHKKKEYEAALTAYERDLAAYKKQKGGPAPIKPVPPRLTRYLVDDITIEALATVLLDNPRGVLIACDELATWALGLERYTSGKSGGNAARMLSLHKTGPLYVDRKTGEPRTICVPHASACIAGGIQPGILSRCFADEQRKSGLLARFLLASPPRRTKEWSDDSVSEETLDRVEAVIDKLIQLRPVPGDQGPEPLPLELTPDATERYKRFYDEHNRETNELSEDLAAAWSKLEEVPLRIALIVQCARDADDPFFPPGESRDIDDESMRIAIALTGWFKHETKRTYAILLETPPATETRRLIEWIERHGGTATPRQVQQGMREFRKKSAEARKALERLVTGGHGHWEQESRATRFVLDGHAPPVAGASADNEIAESNSPPATGGVDRVDGVDVDTATNSPADWGEI